MRTSLIIAVILAIGASLVHGQEERFSVEAIMPFALQSLETYKKIVTQENFAQMGFKSAEEVHSANLGDPMPEFMVRLDHLQKYEPGDDSSNLLNQTNQVYIPVEVDRRSRSMIIVQKNKEEWRPVSFGSSRLIAVLSEIRGMVMEKMEREGNALEASSFFVVRIPALRLYFVGHMIDRQLYLTLAHENPNYKLTPGKIYDGAEVFSIVAPSAKAHDGLPG